MNRFVVCFVLASVALTSEFFLINYLDFLLRDLFSVIPKYSYCTNRLKAKKKINWKIFIPNSAPKDFDKGNEPIFSISN